MNLPVNYRGLTPQKKRLIREEYVRRQSGNCKYCGTPLAGPPVEFIKNKKINKNLFPPNFFEWPVHLHHDHRTGLTVGAVHCHCNAVLWQYHGQ